MEAITSQKSRNGKKFNTKLKVNSNAMNATENKTIMKKTQAIKKRKIVAGQLEMALLIFSLNKTIISILMSNTSSKLR